MPSNQREANSVFSYQKEYGTYYLTSVEETKTVVCDYTLLCMFIHLEKFSGGTRGGNRGGNNR